MIRSQSKTSRISSVGLVGKNTMKRLACSTWADASGIENTTDPTRRSDADILMRGLAPPRSSPNMQCTGQGRVGNREREKKEKRYDVEKGRKYARN